MCHCDWVDKVDWPIARQDKVRQRVRDPGFSRTAATAQRPEQPHPVSDVAAPDLPLTLALATGTMNPSPHLEGPIRNG